MQSPLGLFALLLPIEAWSSTGESDTPEEDAEEVTLSLQPIGGASSGAPGEGVNGKEC